MPRNPQSGGRTTADDTAARTARRNAVPWRKCANMDLRLELEADPPRWLKTFFPKRFNLSWAPYHEEIINGSLYAIKHGTNAMFIDPRGGGKSRPIMGTVLLANFCGLAPFPVYAPWKGESVDAAFRFWRAALENCKPLADLYPEICDPFRVAKGVAQRFSSLTWQGGPNDGKACGAAMAVSDGLIILPDSLGAFGSTTINGNPLGMAFDAPDGSTMRPSVVFLDDPQDLDTSLSPGQVNKIVKKIDGDFGGMGGPDSTLSMIMAATQKGKECVAAHYRADPEWHCKINPRVVSWPHGFIPNDEKTYGLWAEWNHIRLEGGQAKDAGKADREFYVEHREAMTAGMSVSWADRFDSKKGQPDALYSAMVDFFRMGCGPFASEQQGEPLEEGAGSLPYRLSEDIIASRTDKARAPFIVPDWCLLRVASTDLNPSYGFSSAAVGFGADQTAAVLWYGIHKTHIGMDIPDAEFHRLLFAALVAHGKEIAALPCRPDVWHIDAGGKQFPAVLRFVAESTRLCGLQAFAHVGTPREKYRPYGKAVVGQPREYCHMRSDIADGRRRLWIARHKDYWLEVSQRAWLGEIGSPGSLSLFAGHHGEFAAQVARYKLMGKGNVGGEMQWNWHTAPGPHDYADVIAQAYAAAAWQGIGTGGVRAPAQKQQNGRSVRYVNV